MDVIWTRHAGERQREWERRRGVTRREVEDALRKPEQIVPHCAHLLGLNRTPSTLGTYRRDLEQFFTACEARGLRPRGLARLDLLNYLAALVPRYRAGSRVRKTIAIRRFFQFLADEAVLPANPFARVPSPRLERRERRVLSEREYRALRTCARRTSPRAWATVEVLLRTGLRASEVCHLRVGDVTFAGPGQPGLLLVRQGKGHKDRVVPLNSVAEQAAAGVELVQDEVLPEGAEVFPAELVPAAVIAHEPGVEPVHLRRGDDLGGASRGKGTNDVHHVRGLERREVVGDGRAADPTRPGKRRRLGGILSPLQYGENIPSRAAPGPPEAGYLSSPQWGGMGYTQTASRMIR